jgi:hypothetical protein
MWPGYSLGEAGWRRAAPADQRAYRLDWTPAWLLAQSSPRHCLVLYRAPQPSRSLPDRASAMFRDARHLSNTAAIRRRDSVVVNPPAAIAGLLLTLILVSGRFQLHTPSAGVISISRSPTLAPPESLAAALNASVGSNSFFAGAPPIGDRRAGQLRGDLRAQRPASRHRGRHRPAAAM